MDLVLGCAADDLAIEGMTHAAFDGDDGGLVHLVTDDDADHLLAAAPGLALLDTVLH